MYVNKNCFLIGSSRGYADGPQCFHSSTDVTSVLFHVAAFFFYFHFQVTVRTFHYPFTSNCFHFCFCTFINNLADNIYLNPVIYIDYRISSKQSHHKFAKAKLEEAIKVEKKIKKRESEAAQLRYYFVSFGVS